MENQPKNSGELSPEEQFRQDLETATEWYLGTIAEGKGDAALEHIGVKSFDDLTEEQIVDLANKYREGKEKQEAGKADGVDTSPENVAKKRRIDKKLGAAVLALCLSTTMLGASAGITITNLFGKKDKADNNNNLPPTQPGVQNVVDDKDVPVADPSPEVKKEIEYNQHLYFNDPGKDTDHRSAEAICAAETVFADAFGDLDEDTQKLLLEGRTEENAENYDKACKKLLDRGLVRNCEDSHQTTAAYAKRLIDKTDGDYFKKYNWEGLSQDEIEKKIDEMSDEEYAELMGYMGSIFEHTTINGMVADGDWSSHFQRDYDPKTGEKLTNADGSQKVVNYDGGVTRNHSEMTEMHLCKVDENGDFIEGEYYDKTQVVRANVENLKVYMDEQNKVHVELHDSKGNLLEYCLQFEDKGGNPPEPGPGKENDPPKDPTPTPTPTPDGGSGKNKDAEIANAGGAGQAEVQGDPDKQYDPGVGGGESETPPDQGQGEGSATGDTHKDTPSADGSGKSVGEVQADADKKHDEEVTKAPDNGGVKPATDNQERENKAREDEKHVTTPPASGSNGGMTQSEEEDYMKQYQ